jgi:Ca2+-binding EF-hand superfamily protein
MIMLLSALSPILMPVYADHQDDDHGEGTGNGVSLSIFDNSTSSWELISPFQTQFLEEGTHEMEIRSSNLNLNDTYELTWHVSMEEFNDSSYVEENRTWIAYNNESSESFNLTVNEFTCWIMINYELINQSTSSTVDYGFYEFLGPCGNNGVILTNIEIDGNDTLVESFHGPDLWDNMLVLEPGTYDMWYSTGGSGTFTSGNDYIVEWNREVAGPSNYSHTEGMYNWTAGSLSGIGLGSLGWNITVDSYTCEIINDAMLWEAEYFADGEWDKDNSTLMGTTITDMQGPCGEPEYPDVELYYDNGSGPVMYEMVWEYEEFDNCSEYDDGYWECEVDYDGDGYTDYYAGFEYCEWDNNSMTYWCAVYSEVPYLESNLYEFSANISNLEIGADYQVYANYYLNTQNDYESNYEWISWNNSNESHIIDGLYLDIDQYMCSLNLQFNVYMDGNNIMDGEFSFNGDCEEMSSPFELYYDNGTGPVMWEPVVNYESFDNCYEYDGEHWECEVDEDGDGFTDYYYGFEHCEWDNNSMMYWCGDWLDPMLEPGNYTFTLNVSGLEVGEWHELEWWFDGDYDGMSFNATDEYEHFEWDFEINEYMCEFDMEFNLVDYNGMEFNDYFAFNGLCEEMPSPFELYYDNGTGPIMWEPVVNYAAFDNCYEYDGEHWECEVDYDGDGYPDDYYGFEHCEWDNNSMTYWCEMGWNYPMLEPGDYTFTLNVSSLEVGEWHELEWWFNGVYDGMSFNATDEYEHFEWDIEIDEYMCGFSMQVHLMHYDGMHFGDYFSFNTYCEEPVSDHFFELYYDNGTGPVMWEITITNEEFDNCDEFEEGHWECEVDHDGDGYIDHYAHFRDCMWDNDSMTYWCEAHHMPLLEPGDYTLILNATMLVIDTDYKLDWRLHFEGFDYYDESMNTSWTASEEYEHVEWDIEVDESMCMLHSDVEMRTDNTNNSTYGFAHFGFNGLCQEPPQPLELYFNDMLYDDMMMEDESDAPHLEAGTNYMSWSMMGLEVGDEYNLTWSLVQMSMFDEGEGEGDQYTEIFAADSEEMMYDFEAEIENDTCYVMIVGVLSINGSSDGWWLGFVWAMFMGPCEIEMGDVGLDMLNPADGNWYEMYGMNGSESFEMMISMMDEEQVVMDMLENSPELETGNYTMRWAFEDLEVGKEYIVFMEDMMQEMYDNEPEFAYHDNCSEEYNEEDDEWYWLCYVENDDGSVDYISYEYCYEYDDGMYECDLYDNEEDILTTFNASSDSLYYEWELIITDDTCGHVFLVGLVDGESGEDGFPSAMSMYAIAGPNMDNCFGNDDNDGPSPEDWMWMTDTDGDGNMSWDEFISFVEDDESLDNETYELFYQFFTDSDWNGDGTLDMEELSYFLPMIMSLDDEDSDGPSPEDLMSMTDTDGDGNMSWDEFTTFLEEEDSVDNETYELFYQFFTDSDWNGDGTLDMEELSYFIPMIMSLDDDDPDGMGIEDLMYMADYDGDGNMSWDEFYEYMSSSTQDEDDIDNATWDYWADEFDGADGDGDGQLNMDELYEFWSRIMSPDDDGMDAEDLMNMADYDGDGNINWDEFHEFAYNYMGGDDIDNATWDYWADHFEDSDMDSDGQLNMDELYEFWSRVAGDSDDDDWNLEDFAIEQLWSVSLAYTDGVNFTYFLAATQVFDNEFRVAADMAIGNGDGELNTTEAENVYFWLIDALDENPEGPGNITLNGVPGELVFVGYDIMDLPSENGGNPSIVTAWDIHFFDVSANDDGNYEFAYMENIYDNGINTPAYFCAETYEYSYQVMEFIWNGTNIDPADINECISLDIGEIVPSFSITYGQETNVDYDNDGVNNEDDAFPYDPSESMDTDGDGWGDNSDAFPEDGTEWLDTDGDGIGDNADTDYDGDGTDDSMEDSDGDGVNDAEDDFPNDANESTDTDGDGVGDNSDVFPNDANESSDLDGDGIGDNSDDDADGDGTPNNVDAFPLTDSSNDADNDGVANDLDQFPNDPNEYFDSDGDGVGDNADTDDDGDGVLDSTDAFPYDPSETMDTDGDGLGDNADEFPNDATERVDSDGDGVGDNADEFPSDTTEWADTDGDGVGDNSDVFPNDASEIVDSDGDGVGNNADAFPYDANEQSDSDGNGVGDNAQADQENGGTTPVDPEPVEEGGSFLPGFSAIMGIISMLGAAILVAGRRKD